MSTYLEYVEWLGFSGVAEVKMGSRVRSFTFASFDPGAVRKTLGKAKKHEDDLFVFIIAKDKVVRVNTSTKHLWLGNGKEAVAAFLNSVS